MSYTYNNAGQRTSMVENGVGTTSYAFDNYGRFQSLTNAFNETTSVTYDAYGRVNRKNLANGTYEQYTYDDRSRVTAISVKNSLNVEIDRKEYTFDVADRVSGALEGGVTTSYGYDAIDQLISESKPGLSYSASYTYVANGNRLTRTVNGVVENNTYDNADKLLTAGSKTYGYDAAGRTTSVTAGGVTTTLAYDYEDRVTSIARAGMTTNTFTYNGLDTRVGKVDSTGTKTFKRDGIDVTNPVLSDGAANYTPAVSEKRGGVSAFQHAGLKNSNAQTNANQSVSASRKYDAFGNILVSNGTWSGPFGYTGGGGYQEDPDTGLKLLGHRYYDSSTGRFLTRDAEKQGRNWYVYCDSEPITFFDNQGYGKTKVVYWLLKEVREVGGWAMKRVRRVTEGEAVILAGRGKSIGSSTGKGAKRVGKKAYPETWKHDPVPHPNRGDGTPNIDPQPHYQDGRKGGKKIDGHIFYPIIGEIALLLICPVASAIWETISVPMDLGTLAGELLQPVTADIRIGLQYVRIDRWLAE